MTGCIKNEKIWNLEQVFFVIVDISIDKFHLVKKMTGIENVKRMKTNSGGVFNVVLP